MDLLAVKKNQVQFFNLGVNSSFAWASGSYRVASSNSTRNGMSKRRVNTVQEPQYRQHALISDSLDLPNLSLQQEATFATNWIDAAFAMNWIDDRPDGLTLQNFALATMTGPVMSSLPKNLTGDVHYAIDKCESLGSGKNWSFTGIHRKSQGIIPRFWHPSTSFFYRICISVTSGHPRCNFNIVAASGESTAWVLLWKARSRPSGVRFVL